MSRNVKRLLAYYLMSFSLIVLACNGKKGGDDKKDKLKQKINAGAFAQHDNYRPLKKKPDSLKTPDGMIWVPGLTYKMGAQEGDNYALPRERPAHAVAVDGFFIDKTEVTNAEFKEFVDETGYVTVAERPISWQEMKKQLPPGTTKPPDSLLQPGSMVFKRELETITGLNNYGQWWQWKKGADWRHPQGPESDIKEKSDYPVVHIAYEDALKYAQWAGKSLPTEAEWEAAAHGKNPKATYTWGDDEQKLVKQANTWQGRFPIKNNPKDGYKYIAPVKSFPANSLGIYDMAGNVWEFTSDNYDTDYYKNVSSQEVLINPQGSAHYHNPDNPYEKQKIIKGGSFLCNKSYCASYRVSARMGTSMDSGTDHLGFRTVLRVRK